ncbi:MAG: hypothetical protein ABIB47_05870 [Candidatus Woesearchaeota archaeon]
MIGNKGEIAITKVLTLILVVVVVVLVGAMALMGFSSVMEIVFDLIDTFINFLGFG